MLDETGEIYGEEAERQVRERRCWTARKRQVKTGEEQ